MFINKHLLLLILLLSSSFFFVIAVVVVVVVVVVVAVIFFIITIIPFPEIPSPSLVRDTVYSNSRFPIHSQSVQEYTEIC